LARLLGATPVIALAWVIRFAEFGRLDLSRSVTDVQLLEAAESVLARAARRPGEV